MALRKKPISHTRSLSGSRAAGLTLTRPRVSPRITRALVVGGLVLAAIALLIGGAASVTVLTGCDYTALGLGRPLCVQNEQQAEVMLVISIIVLLAGIGTALMGQRLARH